MEQLLNTAEKKLKAANFREALRIYEEVLKTMPDSSIAYQGAAICLFGLERYEEALEQSKKAIEADSNLVVPHTILAYIFHLQGNLDDSRQEASVALHLDPLSADALCCYGSLTGTDGNLDEAIRYLEKAVEIDPTLYRAHHNLSALYQKKGEMRKLFGSMLFVFRTKPTFRKLIVLLSAYFSTNRLVVVLIMLISFVGYLIRIKLLVLFPIPLILFYISVALMLVKDRMWKEAMRYFFSTTLMVIIVLFLYYAASVK